MKQIPNIMIEQALANQMFSNPIEKTFIDKVLSKDDIRTIKDLIKKPQLSRSELLELMYMLVSSESKLLNFGDYERYLINKFFVWLREFIKATELLFDYIEFLEKADNIALTNRGIILLDQCRALLEHNCKFLIDVYLNIGRTSLSVGATGFLELIRNKYEVAYSGLAQEQQPEKKGFLGLGGKK